MYYQVITTILLFPWVILMISILGHFRSRPARKRRPTIVPSGGETAPHPTIPSTPT
jgi:hypothetical protein